MQVTDAVHWLTPDHMILLYLAIQLQCILKSSSCTTLMCCDFSPFKINGLKSHRTEMHGVNRPLRGKCDL